MSSVQKQQVATGPQLVEVFSQTLVPDAATRKKGNLKTLFVVTFGFRLCSVGVRVGVRVRVCLRVVFEIDIT